MTRRRQIQVILNLALACLLVFEAIPTPQPAEAGPDPFNAAVGFIRVINGINRRNRIYRAARDTKKDFDAYYGSLRDTAHRQLLEGDLSSLRHGVEGPERTRASAYIRMAAAMQAEQAAVQRAVDAETNAARREFNRTLAHQLQSLILQLPGAQRILGDVRSTISNIRRTAIAIQAAASAGQPVDNLAAELAQQITYSAELQQAVRNLGTMADSELNRHLGGALNQVDLALGDIKNQANQTVQLLDTMDAEVGQWDLSQAELGTGEGEIGPVNVLLTDRATAVLDVASQALAFLSAAQGSGGITRQQLYQQIRADLLNQRNANLLNAALQVNSVVCAQVDQKTYLAAAKTLGEAPGTPSDSSMASYYVCTNKETGEPVGAWVGRIDGSGEGADASPTAGPAESSSLAPEGERLTIEELDGAAYLSTDVAITNSWSNDLEQSCNADYQVTNNHPTDTLTVTCEEYSHIRGYDPSTKPVGTLLTPGETDTFGIYWHFALGELRNDTHLTRCIARRISDAEGRSLPGAYWFSVEYPEDSSKFESGLTVIVPPNPCAP
jgi:hypothetical protein